MPNILAGVTVTDNISLPAKIKLTQSPAAGTVLTQTVTVATITATDEDGNATIAQVSVVTRMYPPLNLRFVTGDNPTR
jgi:hypothetical protein